jgi:hypothetical protein
MDEMNSAGCPWFSTTIPGPVRLTRSLPRLAAALIAETAVRVPDLPETSEGGSTLLSWWRRWALNPLAIS